MQSHRVNRYGWQWLFTAITLMGLSSSAMAQVVPDATLGNGNNSVTNTVGDRTDITGGLQRNSSLFHSFERFNIGTNQQVYFANPAAIRNIFSRVTGGSLSNIDGTLGVAGSANLFFINPNGIIFGPNARLDVAGSFFASTANVLEFPDNQRFEATGDRRVPLVEVNIPIGLQFGANPPAMLTNRGNLAAGQDLTLAAGNLDLQGQLTAGGNLTLNATDVVTIRDTLTEPFIAQTGNQLQIQGDQSVDIFALNHPSSGLISGGDMVLRSATPVIGDAHYFAGGNFRVEQLDGSLGSLYSPNDPVFQVAGNYTLDNYNGDGSLQILAGGSVTIGSITVDTPANTFNDNAINLSDGTPVGLSGTTRPVLDIRAGTTTFFSTPSVGVGLSPITTADINITGPIVVGTLNNPGVTLLTNQFSPNTLPGSITLGGPVLVYGPVYLDSRGSITTGPPTTQFGGIDTSAPSGTAGEIRLIANGTIDTTAGYLNSAIGSFAANGNVTLQDGTAGNITLISRNGEVRTAGLFSSVFSGTSGDISISAGGNIQTGQVRSLVGRITGTIAAGTILDGGSGVAGDVRLFALGDIRTASITAFSNTTSGYNTIDLNSQNGSVFINGVSFNATNINPDGLGGDIFIDAAGAIEVTDSQIESQGRFGRILLGQRSSADETITIRNSSLNAETIPGGNAGSSETPGIIFISGQTIDVDNSFLTTTTSAQTTPGSINLQALNAITIRNRSTIRSTVDPDAGNQNSTASPSIRIVGGAVNISGSSTIDTSTAGRGQAADILVQANNGQVIIQQDSDILSQVIGNATGPGGDITIRGGTITIAGTGTNNPNSDVPNVYVGTQINASNASTTGAIGGNIYIAAADTIEINNQSLITTQLINTGSFGTGGNVSLGGPLTRIDNSQVTTTVQAGATGNSGDITIGNFQLPDGTPVSTDTLQLNGSELASNAVGTGNSGAINLDSNQTVEIQGGSIRTTANSDSGVAGNISITADADGGQAISLDSVNVNAAATGLSGQTGSVTINATNRGDVTLSGDVTSTSPADQSEVSTETFGNRPTGELTVRGGNILIDRYSLNATVQPVGSNGGSILIDGDSITVQGDSNITTQTSGPGSGGDITVQTTGGNILLNSGEISSTVNPDATGNGGAISINSNGGDITFGNTDAGTAFNVNAQTQSTNTAGSGQTNGVGGNVSVISQDGEIAIVAASNITAGTTGTRDSGTITFQAGDGGISLADGSNISTSATLDDPLSGNAGSVLLETRRLRIDNSQIEASTEFGVAGNITLQNLNSLQMNQGEITASTTNGTAGDVLINNESSPASSITLTGGSNLTVEAVGSGNSGLVSLNTRQLTLLQGSTISASTVSGVGEGIEIRRLNNLVMDSSVISASTTNGTAGDVLINNESSPASSITLTGGSNLTAEAVGSGNSGLVSLNTRQLTLLQNSRVSASTISGVGEGIEILGLNNLTMDESRILASTATGRAGSISVIANDSVTLQNNSVLSAQASSGGTAGSIEISTGTLTVNGDGSEGGSSVISVSSPTGRAGSVTVRTTGDLNLDQGTISAEAGAGNEANITLTVGGPLLLMQNGSLISTKATGSASGGNITINAKFGYVVGFTLEDSDIVADAVEGNGGRIDITTNAIVGLQFRQQRTVFSDITASSEFGQSGSVALNALTTDDVRGLSTPTIVFTDTSQVIGSACEAVGAKSAASSELRISGQGGVPLSPTAPLPAQNNTSDWVSLNITPQAPTSISFPNGSAVTLEPGQTYTIQTLCIRAWKKQQQSSSPTQQPITQ